MTACVPRILQSSQTLNITEGTWERYLELLVNFSKKNLDKIDKTSLLSMICHVEEKIMKSKMFKVQFGSIEAGGEWHRDPSEESRC